MVTNILCNLQTNSYDLFVCQKRQINLFKLGNTKYNLIKTMFVYLAVSETQRIIYRPDLHNSQASQNQKNLQAWLILKFSNISELQGFS